MASDELTLGYRLGCALSYVSEWLAKLPALFSAMNRPACVSVLALEILLVEKGLVDRGELEQAKKQARAGLMIEESVGGIAEAVAEHMATFRPTVLAILGGHDIPPEVKNG